MGIYFDGAEFSTIEDVIKSNLPETNNPEVEVIESFSTADRKVCAVKQTIYSADFPDKAIVKFSVCIVEMTEVTKTEAKLEWIK